MLETCKENYIEWKEIAKKEKDLNKKIEYLKKSLFWLENYVLLKEIFELEEVDREKAEKLKVLLTKKLSKYLEQLLS